MPCGVWGDSDNLLTKDALLRLLSHSISTFLTSKKRTTSTKWLIPKCPLLGGSTVYKVLLDCPLLSGLGVSFIRGF